MTPAIGFLGLGEAGSAIAGGLRGEGVSRLYGYDVLATSPSGAAHLRARAATCGVELVASGADLARRAGIIFSTVVPGAAREAAAAVAPHLTAEHFFVDLNSCSPEVKQETARLVESSGARFVEAAVMGAVLRHEHRVPMLLAGPAAADLVDRLAACRMRLEVMGETVGQASATKLFRSMLIKGMEALLAEVLPAAMEYGVDRRVLDSVTETMAGADWIQWADYLMGRTVLHGGRRADEMDQVIHMLGSLGVEPIMATAAATRLRTAAGLSRAQSYDGPDPPTYREIVRAWKGSSRA